MLEIITNDVFWLGLAVGYVIATIVGVIVECVCIKFGKANIDTWMEEEGK